MILPDVNVLVYAYRVEAAQHDSCKRWLENVIAGADELALHDMVFSGFVRIVTNPRIVDPPATCPEALQFVDALTAAARSRWLEPGRAAWKSFRSLAEQDSQVRGNLVPDAFLAALCLTHNAGLASCDRGFARFKGLALVDPTAG